MKLLLKLILIFFSYSAFADDNALERALNERWFECHEAIYNNNFKGEPLLEDGVDIPDTEHELRKKFFTVPDDAVEKFIIGQDGQPAGDDRRRWRTPRACRQDRAPRRCRRRPQKPAPPTPARRRDHPGAHRR